MLWYRTVATDRGHVADAEGLVLVHGLGGTADLWEGVLGLAADRWPGPVVAVDLPGHGRSPRANRYAEGRYAAAVAEAATEALGRRPVALLGHSLGGVVCLTLATGLFGLDVTRCVGLGMKVTWSDEDLAGMAALASRPTKVFATRAEAAERFVLVNGLHGALDPAGPTAAGGIVEVDGGWRLAHDMATMPDRRPDIAPLLRIAAVPVTVACGEGDGMTSAAELAPYGCPMVVIPGAGHNTHVEAPDATLRLIEDATAT